MLYVYLSGAIAMWYFAIIKIPSSELNIFQKILAATIAAAIWPILFWYAVFDNLN